MLRASDFKRGPTAAQVFHGLAGSLLADLGFVLVNDPSQILGRFGESDAIYRSPRRLSLCVGFDPVDSDAARVTCGREWSVQQQLQYLSNLYSVLAKRFGVDTPLFYPLGSGDQTNVTLKAILADLTRTLPLVVPRVTLDDLLHIEREQYGAESRALARFGPEYLQHVQISSYG
ncbi:MAG TPA: hypothetical protein VJT10_24545 [Steroidobacteraceae bacterium]|nr:hypothetical protein [Steroidobacteraceae bacterium]